MTGHTPGPWVSLGSGIGRANRFSGLEPVCLLLPPPEDEFDFAIWEANARLIAAAPDLLSLANMVAAYFASTDSVIGGAARDVIAKAAQP